MQPNPSFLRHLPVSSDIILPMSQTELHSWSKRHRLDYKMSPEAPTITGHPLTCAGCEAYLAETLASWRACDWGQVVDPEVLVYEEAGENIPQKVFNGFVRIMRGALAGKPRGLSSCEAHWEKVRQSAVNDFGD